MKHKEIFQKNYLYRLGKYTKHVVNKKISKQLYHNLNDNFLGEKTLKLANITSKYLLQLGDDIIHQTASLGIQYGKLGIDGYKQIFAKTKKLNQEEKEYMLKLLQQHGIETLQNTGRYIIFIIPGGIVGSEFLKIILKNTTFKKYLDYLNFDYTKYYASKNLSHGSSQPSPPSTTSISDEEKTTE